MKGLRAFLNRESPPLGLESHRVEHAIEPFWMGRPARAPYALQMAAAVSCGVLALLFEFRTDQSPALLLSGLLIATLLPFIAAHDWYLTEYILAGDLVVVRAGAFARGTASHQLDECTSVEEESNWLARRLGYRNLVLATEDEDGSRQIVATLRHVPAHVAEAYLDVLELLNEPPQETVIT